MTSLTAFDCADCGATTLRRGPTHRYCAPCSATRDNARKTAWAKHNPAAPLDAYARQQSAMVQSGAERSTANRASMAWMADAAKEDDFRAMLRLAMPFDWAASKNAVWRTGRGGHVYARKESVDWRGQLAQKIRDAGLEWFDGKVYLDVFVEKPNHKGDAINVLDLVADAVKDATGVDDRWYSVRRLDWSIVKQEPRILVGIAQRVGEHHRVCSHCGRELVLEDFGRNRSAPRGRTRVCRDCSAPKKGRKS